MRGFQFANFFKSKLLSLENGFKEISLGESRLRTETAALYACGALNVLNE